jgi:hypothetical protein
MIILKLNIPAKLLSREVEGPALRSLGNQPAASGWPGANSGRMVFLEDERWSHPSCPFCPPEGAFFVSASPGREKVQGGIDDEA